MSTVVFYRWSLLLPIVCPFFCLPLIVVEAIDGVPDTVRGNIDVFIWTMAYSLIIGGIPYLLTLGFFTRDFRSNDAQRIIRAGLLLPVAMAGLLVALSLLLFAYSVVIGGERSLWGTLAAGAPVVLGLCACTLVLGYLYVAIAGCFHELFRRVRWIRND